MEDPDAVAEELLAAFGEDPVAVDAGLRALYRHGMDNKGRGVDEAEKRAKGASMDGVLFGRQGVRVLGARYGAGEHELAGSGAELRPASRERWSAVASEQGSREGSASQEMGIWSQSRAVEWMQNQQGIWDTRAQGVPAWLWLDGWAGFGCKVVVCAAAAACASGLASRL